MRINKLFLRWIAVFGVVMAFAVSGWGAGDGLVGNYYKKSNSTYNTYPISGTPDLTRTDSTVNFDWGTGNPGIGQNDYYQAKWTGYVYIPTAGSWTFYTSTDDGVKLSIDGTMQIDKWVDQAPTEYSKTLTLTAGYHAIQMDYYENGGGAVARLSWSGPSVSKAIIPQNNLYTVAPKTLTISDASLVEGDSGVTYMNFTVTLSTSANVTVNYATSDGTATSPSDYNATSGTLTFTAGGATTKTISVPIFGDTDLEGYETFTVTLSNATGGATIGDATATGTINNDDTYCKSNSLSTGFHIIDPDGGSETNSFEIFCSADSPKKDLIALSNKNSSNNFIFKTNTLGSTNYYSEASTNATHFNAIEINPLTMQVLTSGSLDPTNAGSYKIMGKGFSNINLLGTPFAIDWDNTTISGCDTTKLTRKGYHGQAVKINALDYNNQARCQIDSMKLKLLSDYTYLKYEGTEVLEKTCKEMAEAVPTDFLDSSTVKGHYWISPNNNSRSHNSTSITAMDRPIVAYCWYQTDLDYVWTFFLAMDGKVTNKKDDLINKVDTCSEKGLWPFIANSEKTFDRVRAFLTDKKSEWVSYTGTNNEKFRAFNNGSNYYLGTEYDGPIWPYGSFGVYFPYNGNNDANGASKTWGGTSTNKTGWMSGSPMHNVSMIAEDYPRKNNDSGVSTRDYYSWGHYSSTDTSSGGNYAYSDTMGAKGWRSVLKDLNKTTEWFISRSGAGDNFDSTGNYPYYEPNGNYTANAWVNFLYDDQGRVRHLDDYDAKYSYYDYMCMAEDNYDFTTRYGLVKGPFNVVEHDAVLSGTGYRDAKLSTKIAKDTMRFDVVLLRNDLSDIRTSADVSYGLFLDDTVMVGGSETPRDLHYFGESNSTFQGLGTRFELTANKWPNSVESWPTAKKRLFFKFRYCSINTMDWTGCWTQVGNTAVCKAGSESICKTADSNDFAVRPKTFGSELLTPLPLKAGAPFSINLSALDYSDLNTTDYNESENISFDAIVKEVKTGCIKGVFKKNLESGWKFTNGVKQFVDNNYSEVGVLDINLTESLKPCQSRFAAIDCNDTVSPDLSVLSISDHTTQLSFTPHHFDLLGGRIKNNDINGSFTYLSHPYATATQDYSMGSHFDLNITAKDYNENRTKNYNTLCYAKPKDINITYSPSSIPNLSKIYMQLLHDDVVVGDTSHTLSAKLNFSGVTKDIFTTDHNGTAVLHFKINYDRDETKTVNKFDFNSSKIDVKTTDEVNATIIPSGGATYVYGRLIPRDVRVFGTNPFTANGWYEVFNTPILGGTTLPPSKNGSSWFVNLLHNDKIDGNADVTRVIPNTLALPANSVQDPLHNGIGVETYTFGGGVVPYSGKAHIDVAPWLWYGETALGYADPGKNVDGTLDGAVDENDCLHHPCFNINVVPNIGRGGSATSTDLRDKKLNKSTTRGTGVTYDYTPATR
ncbi:PA14 domain-containing protein [Sulfuricurvum sp.]|uniref:PA14 domain-containing protein n=1 Tax=Sulfuricurvum sp. TaxID=2025608 RepID=UPI002E310A62|nr:PA14 domain-containing protein [Sulfuricurvum sp.]HEX5329287.1 PA14 domain-containing protein [Sulfuricurvum sp.]